MGIKWVDFTRTSEHLEHKQVAINAESVVAVTPAGPQSCEVWLSAPGSDGGGLSFHVQGTVNDVISKINK
ncbi:hypothetical protein IWQ49_004444 [Labrenzia sp. EL_126]|nr:hypothetical protein [Labrenzia sp. EL_126]